MHKLYLEYCHADIEVLTHAPKHATTITGGFSASRALGTHSKDCAHALRLRQRLGWLDKHRLALRLDPISKTIILHSCA